MSIADDQEPRLSLSIPRCAANVHAAHIRGPGASGRVPRGIVTNLERA
jgi:hypothetical protein